MDYLRSFAISAAGMGVERARVETAAVNLAQAHVAQAPGQPAFQPLRVVATSSQGFAAMVSESADALPRPAALVEPSGAPPRRVHDPGHPLADARGFVGYPGVDPAAEMVTLMGATRSYEANVAALNTARALALKTLEIGRNP
jgi:flagellar basal-body rod protein FlgC